MRVCCECAAACARAGAACARAGAACARRMHSTSYVFTTAFFLPHSMRDRRCHEILGHPGASPPCRISAHAPMCNSIACAQCAHRRCPTSLCALDTPRVIVRQIGRRCAQCSAHCSVRIRAQSTGPHEALWASVENATSAYAEPSVCCVLRHRRVWRCTRGCNCAITRCGSHTCSAALAAQWCGAVCCAGAMGLPLIMAGGTLRGAGTWQVLGADERAGASRGAAVAAFHKAGGRRDISRAARTEGGDPHHGQQDAPQIPLFVRR